jgi:hypothetical protein
MIRVKINIDINFHIFLNLQMFMYYFMKLWIVVRNILNYSLQIAEN